MAQLPSQFDRYAENTDLIQALLESGLQLGTNTFADIKEITSTYDKNPIKGLLGSGNKELADAFTKRQEANRPPTYTPTQQTQDIQKAIMEQYLQPTIEKLGELGNTWAARNPNAAESISGYFNDPRVKQTGKLAVVAAPILERLSRTLMDANFGDNLRGASGGNKQEGFILPAEEAIKRTDKAGMTDLSTKLAINHQIAQQMQADGASPLEIAQKTEFHPIPNKQGRDDLVWEVPGRTTQTDIKPSRTGRADGYDKFSDYYKNDLLYKIVPELKKTGIDYTDEARVGEGWFNRIFDRAHLGTDATARGNIGLKDKDIADMFDAGIHEISHKGQQLFNMNRGGSPSNFSDGKHLSPVDRLLGKPQPAYQEIAEALRKGEQADFLLNEYPELRPSPKKALQEVADQQKAFKEEGWGDPFGLTDKSAGKILADDFRNKTSTKFQKYHQLAGEASANADMQRNWMTDAARLAKPYGEHMAEMGGVINPRMLRFKQDGAIPFGDAQKIIEDAFTGSKLKSTGSDALGKRYDVDGGTMSVMENSKWSPRPNSLTNIEVDENMRGKGIASKLMDGVLENYDLDTISSAASNPITVKMLYDRGLRPYGDKDASLEDALKQMREQSSVTMHTPEKTKGVTEIEDAIQFPDNQRGMIQLLGGDIYGEPDADWLQKLSGALIATQGGNQNRIRDYITPPERQAFDPRFDKRVNEQAKLAGMETRFDRSPTDIPEVSIFDYEGYPIVSSMADRTISQGNMTGIRGVELDRPIPTFGGQGHPFMPENVKKGQAWASGVEPVKDLMGVADELYKQYGKSPLLVPWRMAPTGGDFSTTTGETMLGYASKNMDATTKKELDKSIEDFVSVGTWDKKAQKQKNAGKVIGKWSGVDDPKSVEQWRNAPDSLRKELKNMMNVKYRNKGGLGIGEARLAGSDPGQLKAPDAGVENISRIDVGRPVIQESGHPSYPKGVPGEGLGRLKEDFSIFNIMDALVKERGMNRGRVRNPSARDKRAMQMKAYGGILDEKTLRRIEDALMGK